MIFSARITLALLLGLPALQAAVSDFNVESAISHAVAHNPELRVARAKIAVAQSKLKWTGRLEDPELELGLSSDQLGLNDDERIFEIAVAQKFPLTKRLERARELSRVDLALAKTEVAVQEWKLAGDVRETAVEYLALKQNLMLHAQIRDVLEEIVSNLEQAFQHAEASQIDVTESKLEVQTQIGHMREVEAKLSAKAAVLRALLGLPAETKVRIQGDLHAPTPHLRTVVTNEMLARRPDLQLRALEENRAKAEIELAKSQRWQDVALRLFLEREASVDDPTGLERNTFLGVSFSIPIPFRTPKSA